MSGSCPFLIDKTEKFEKSLEKLVKSYKSRSEPLPNGIKLPQEWVLYKLRIMFAKGASGHIRIIYLVNEEDRIIKPLWIYNHQQFAKRPPEQDIETVIKQLFLD